MAMAITDLVESINDATDEKISMWIFYHVPATLFSLTIAFCLVNVFFYC